MDFNTIQEISNFKRPDVLPYNMRDDVKKAMDDFRYLCTQSYYVVLANMGLLSVNKEQKQYANVLCIPFDVNKKSANFPKDQVKPDDPKMHVAIMCYSDGKVVDTLLISGATIVKECRPLSKFGSFFTSLFGGSDMIINEEGNEYVIKINNINHPGLRKYAFGYAIGQLQG